MRGSNRIDQLEAMVVKENDAMSTNHWHMYYERRRLSMARSIGDRMKKETGYHSARKS
jgi:hypothetical protein